MNSLKLLTLIAVTTGLVAGSSVDQVTPTGESLDHPPIGSVRSYDFPEMSAGLRLVLAGRLVVASADSGYRPVASGGGSRREL